MQMVVKNTCEEYANNSNGNLIFSDSSRTGIRDFNLDLTWRKNTEDYEKEVAIIKVYKPINLCSAVQIFSQDTPNLEKFTLVWAKEDIIKEEKGNSMNTAKLADFGARGFSSISKEMTGTVWKVSSALKKPKAKFLSLNVNNGEANVKEIIYQACATGIKDPRPYVNDIIAKELNRLHSYLVKVESLKDTLGFNLKLLGMFDVLQEIAKQPLENMTVQNAVEIYEFLKEYDSYQIAVSSNNNVCPYKWVEAHLTHENLNSTKPVTLFTSNKINIYIEDGYITYEETTPKTHYGFTLEIKFSVVENKFYL